MRVKLIYTTFSHSEFGKAVFFRIAFLIIFYFLVREYNNNPGLILVLMILDVLFFLLIGYDKIIICEDRMIVKNRSFYEMIFNPKGATYLFDDTGQAKLPAPGLVRTIIRVRRIIGMPSWFFLRLISKEKDWVSFYFEMKGGGIVPVYTDLDEEEIHKIVGIINALILERTADQSISAQYT